MFMPLTEHRTRVAKTTTEVRQEIRKGNQRKLVVEGCDLKILSNTKYVQKMFVLIHNYFLN